ncbi:monocarboxylate transporter 13-like [Plodia interpunctella]|uniref:monocarboxylate transporter 13-like n=1 Tax=Plodia interpunctella TaxID=58824 RepID=UPI0023688F3A|nr:monocarboxylate transporter 13-like [Plodia interpunctella]
MSDQTKCKKVLGAPDGGWGYLIGIATIINFTLTAGFMSCFGILYNEFIEKLKIGSATVVLITGANAMSVAVSGFLTSPLLKVMKFRLLAFVAASLFNIGCLGNIFANSIIPFFVCQSVLQGFGFGILYNLTCTLFNEYFVKKRFFAMGVVQTFTAIFTMGIPILLNTTLNLYGYRGTLMIISALTMNLFVAIVLMQPVKWHMKLIEAPHETEEAKSLLLKNDNEGIPIIKIIDIERNPPTEDKNITDDVKKLPVTEDKVSAPMKLIKEMFDVYLLKSFLPTYASLGVTMALLADFVTTVMLPQTLYAANWSEDDTAIAMSVMSFGDLSARVFFILSSKCIKLPNKELHMIGVVIAILPRIGFLLTKNLYAVLGLLFVVGVSRCFLTTLIPLIIADAVSSDKFTSAMGMFMMLMGVSNLSLGSVVGAIRDLTGTYDTIVWISAIFLIFTITQGLIEKYCLECRHKKKCQEQ